MKPKKIFFPSVRYFLFKHLHPLLEKRFIIPQGKNGHGYLIFPRYLTKFSMFSFLSYFQTTKRKLSKISTQKTYIVKSSDLWLSIYCNFWKTSPCSPLLESPPLWHIEALLAGQSSYHKNSIFLEKNKILHWEQTAHLCDTQKVGWRDTRLWSGSLEGPLFQVRIALLQAFTVF